MRTGPSLVDDLEALIREDALKLLGATDSQFRDTPLKNLLILAGNAKMRMIESRPREVLRSREVEEELAASSYRGQIVSIENSIRTGVMCSGSCRVALDSATRTETMRRHALVMSTTSFRHGGFTTFICLWRRIERDATSVPMICSSFALQTTLPTCSRCCHMTDTLPTNGFRRSSIEIGLLPDS